MLKEVLDTSVRNFFDTRLIETQWRSFAYTFIRLTHFKGCNDLLAIYENTRLILGLLDPAYNDHKAGCYADSSVPSRHLYICIVMVELTFSAY